MLEKEKERKNPLKEKADLLLLPFGFVYQDLTFAACPVRYRQMVVAAMAILLWADIKTLLISMCVL